MCSFVVVHMSIVRLGGVPRSPQRLPAGTHSAYWGAAGAGDRHGAVFARYIGGSMCIYVRICICVGDVHSCISIWRHLGHIGWYVEHSVAPDIKANNRYT